MPAYVCMSVCSCAFQNTLNRIDLHLLQRKITFGWHNVLFHYSKQLLRVKYISWCLGGTINCILVQIREGTCVLKSLVKQS